MNGFTLYQSEMLNGIPGLVHAFGGRGLDTKAPEKIPQELRYLGIPPDRIFTLRQVHSPRVLLAREEDLGKRGTMEGDGAVCLTPGLGVGILTADCLPVIISSGSGRGLAMIHGGWRGLHSGIVESGLTLYRELTGVEPDAIRAAIGPAASSCCYVVGPDVAEVFTNGYRDYLRKTKGERYFLDLEGICVKKLVTAGLLKQNIDRLGVCTICDGQFHSVRRDGRTELRQISVAYLI